MTYTARYEQVVPVPPDTVRRFFANIQNLVRVSPSFPVITVSADDPSVAPGAVFRIRLWFVLFALHWNVIIERAENDGSFIDSWSGGPFTAWRHTHRFDQAGTGTRIIDEIEYKPAWWFSPFAGSFVRVLFSVRRRKVAGVFA